MSVVDQFPADFSRFGFLSTELACGCLSGRIVNMDRIKLSADRRPSSWILREYDSLCGLELFYPVRVFDILLNAVC